ILGRALHSPSQRASRSRRAESEPATTQLLRFFRCQMSCCHFHFSSSVGSRETISTTFPPEQRPHLMNELPASTTTSTFTPLPPHLPRVAASPLHSPALPTLVP